MKNIWYLRKYICIQRNIFVFNQKYLCSMQSIFIQTHENIILNKGLLKILFRIFFIFHQRAINCIMVSRKKSGL